MVLNTAICFKALGDENRLAILRLLGPGEKCACKLLEALNITQPTLSHHMKILCDCGLVLSRREGKWMRYRLNTDTIRNLSSALQALTDEKGA